MYPNRFHATLPVHRSPTIAIAEIAAGTAAA